MIGICNIIIPKTTAAATATYMILYYDNIKRKLLM
jgi:hypothetical protein